MMPEVSSIGNGPPGPLKRTPLTSATPNGTVTGNAPETGDRVELSERAQQMEQSQTPVQTGVRNERIEAVREAIESGRYETEERMAIAIDRLVKDLRG